MARKKAKRKFVVPNVLTRSGLRKKKIKATAEITKDVVDAAGSEDCCICMDQAKIPLRLACKHVFCFLCIKGVAMSGGAGRVCPLCRTPIDDDYIDLANMSKKVFQQLHSESQLASQWQYRGRSAGWWLYDDETNEIIEDNYQTYIDDLRELEESDSDEEKEDAGKGTTSRNLVIQSDDDSDNEDKGNSSDSGGDNGGVSSSLVSSSVSSSSVSSSSTSSSSVSSAITPALNAPSSNAPSSSTSSSSSLSNASSSAQTSQPPKKKRKISPPKSQPSSKECTIVIGSSQYFIDFERMSQISVQNTKKTRKIRRSLLQNVIKNTKGQAGVQFNK